MNNSIKSGLEKAISNIFLEYQEKYNVTDFCENIDTICKIDDLTDTLSALISSELKSERLESLENYIRNNKEDYRKLLENLPPVSGLSVMDFIYACMDPDGKPVINYRIFKTDGCLPKYMVYENIQGEIIGKLNSGLLEDAKISDIKLNVLGHVIEISYKL